MRYSQEFKDNVVARLLSKELSISEAVEQYSIGKSTISYWLKIAREQAGCGTLPNKGNPKLMASLKLPKGVTYLQAHTAVNAKAFMSETDFGQFCRNMAISPPQSRPGPNGLTIIRMWLTRSSMMLRCRPCLNSRRKMPGRTEKSPEKTKH